MTVDWNTLRDAAHAARTRSHSPYSGFAVGAAALGTSGTVYTGANVEVSSYGLTLCAERLAVFKAIEAGEEGIVALALVADTETPCPPCGACRQVIADFGPEALVLQENLKGAERLSTAAELLPDAFTPSMLLALTRDHALQMALPGLADGEVEERDGTE